jgi:hypothetical protein
MIESEKKLASGQRGWWSLNSPDSRGAARITYPTRRCFVR